MRRLRELSLVLGCVLLTYFTDSAAQEHTVEESRLRLELFKTLDSGTELSADELKRFYLRPTKFPIRTQKTAQLAATIQLGRKLFFDPRLSRDGKTSCATCHDPQKNWTDGLPQSSEGNRRRSMSLFNLAWDSCYTWHCTAGSLMSQAMLALTASKGMGANPFHASELVASPAGYARELQLAFPNDEHRNSPGNMLAAIEYYVSTILSPTAPFDRWVEGDDDAISTEAQRGFVIFNTKAECARCHNLWRFSDGRPYDTGWKETDPDAEPFYKAVGLRNIADRPPYMHDGSLKTLADVITFYNRGGDVNRPTKSPHIRPLNLTAEERLELLEFLNTLSGKKPTPKYPTSPPKGPATHPISFPSHASKNRFTNPASP